MRILFMTFVCALAFAALPTPIAYAATPYTHAVGDSCTAASQLGHTERDIGGMNIVACVKDDDGAYRWKSQTVHVLTYGNVLCGTGQYITRIVNGQATCSSSVTLKDFTCPKGVDRIVNGVPHCTSG
jgi:hypothetical protein